MPQVSIVMSTFNRVALLPRAIASVLSQRDVDIEFIVVDDGSTDGTSRVLAQVNDSRLRIVRNDTSLGPTGGRNAGLAQANGDWLALHDDDDVWAPRRLVAMLTAAISTDRSWAYSGAVHIDDQVRIVDGVPAPSPEEIMRQLPYRWVIPGGISNIIWHRETLDDWLLDPQLVIPTDWDLALRLAAQGPPACVPQPLLACQRHHGNLIHQLERRLSEFEYLERKTAGMREGAPLDWGLLHRFLGAEALRWGDRRGAVRRYWRGVRGGDLGCAVRATKILLPRRLNSWLQTRRLSDRSWIDQAEPWLAPVRRGTRAVSAERNPAVPRL